MIVVQAPAADEDILKVVERWIALIAEHRYDEACALLIHDEANQNWSAPMLAEVFRGYEALEGRGQVTPVATAREEDYRPDQDVDWWVEETGPFAGDIHYSLPLNGVWSDLTAMFNIRRVQNGFALELDDIHVL